MTERKTVRLESLAGVARITLDRPDAGNALDIPTARQLLHAALACDSDPTVRCVLLEAAGRQFCVGGDVRAFESAGAQMPHFLKEITTYLHAAIATLARMDKPLVSAVQGAAAGAGIGLAVLADIVLAGPQASFILAYGGVGLSPDAGATWLLPRLIGLRRTQELLFTSRRVDAGEALSIGLVTRVVQDQPLTEGALEVARELADGPRRAYGATRQLLLESFSHPLEAQLELESRSIAQQGRLDGIEGVTAFLQKRRAVYVDGTNAPDGADG